MSRIERLKDYERPLAEFEEVRGRVRSIAFLIAGAAIGAGVALVLAPNSGEEIRHVIGRRFRKTVKRIGRLRERAEDLMEHAQDLREHAQDLRERGSKLLRFGRRRRAVEAVRRFREA